MELEDLSTHHETDEFFHHRGEIFIFEEITPETSLRIVRSIRYLDAILPPDDPISIFINSGGGSSDDAVAIIDEFSLVKRRVFRTIAQGTACSAAGYILACGTQGQRWATPNSTIMLHPATIEPGADYAVQQHRYVEFAKKQDEWLSNLIGKACGKSRNLKKFRESISDGLWMTAKEAKRFGVIDGIL